MAKIKKPKQLKALKVPKGMKVPKNIKGLKESKGGLAMPFPAGKKKKQDFELK
jgi:hypothetical protein